MIRKARLDDAQEIHRLINSWAKKGSLLERPLNYIYEHLRDFSVYVDGVKIIGCCSLNVVGWKELAEIKSLAVARPHHKRGIGSRLVCACLDEARTLGVKQVFALTYVPGFFKKFGFKTIDRKRLPHKIWSDCIYCPEFPDCGETAVILRLRPKQ